MSKELICAVTGKPTTRRGGLFQTNFPVKTGEFCIKVSVEHEGKSKPVSTEGLAKLIKDSDLLGSPKSSNSK